MSDPSVPSRNASSRNASSGDTSSRGSSPRSVLIVGGGVFGMTAAIELRRRGHRVTLLDPGPLPRPEAASTDVSKAVRMDYGADAFYEDLAARALDGWRTWNRAWGQTVFREDGILFLTEEPMQDGSFEHDSFVSLRDRGVAVERTSPTYLAARHPAFVASRFQDGYFNPRAGWVDSAAAMTRLGADARELGVTLEEGVRIGRLSESFGRVVGAVDDAGDERRADTVVVAAGAWTRDLVSETRELISVVGQPVMFVRPARPERFRPPQLPVWAADLSRLGWFGFPTLPDGTVKVCHHGRGRVVGPDDPRVVAPDAETRMRRFLRDALPDLATAPVVGSRLCLYTDTWDGDFYIDHVPGREGLVVATGGSGHGFKFAPVLGAIVADVVERAPSPDARRFAWRPRGERRREAARSHS